MMKNDEWSARKAACRQLLTFPRESGSAPAGKLLIRPGFPRHLLSFVKFSRACPWNGRPQHPRAPSATGQPPSSRARAVSQCVKTMTRETQPRSEEHTSELQSLMRISYAVFCL